MFIDRVYIKEIFIENFNKNYSWEIILTVSFLWKSTQIGENNNKGGICNLSCVLFEIIYLIIKIINYIFMSYPLKICYLETKP